MMRRSILRVGALALALVAFPGFAAAPRAADAARIARNAPPRLPAAIRDYLRSRSCRIPETGPRCTTLRGRFLSPTRVDWAVWCLSESASSLLVFPGDSTDRVEEVVPDVPGPNPVIESTCRFQVAGPRAIRNCLITWGRDAVDGGSPPPVEAIDHDGIRENVGGGNSVIHYRHLGRWITILEVD